MDADPSDRYVLSESMVVAPARVCAEIGEQLDALRRASRDSGVAWSAEASAWVAGLVKVGREHRERRREEITSDLGSSEGRAAEVAAQSTHELDVFAAAGLLGVGDRRVRQLADSGELAGIKVGGRWVFTYAAVERFREARDL